MKICSGIIKKADQALGLLARSIAIVCLALLFLLLTGNVVFRLIPVISFGWFDEVVEMAFAWLVFMGSAALWREREHFQIDLLLKKLSGRRSGHMLRIVLDLIALAFFAILFYYGLRLTILAMDWTPVFRMPKKLLYASIPVSGAYMIIYTIRDLVQDAIGLTKSFSHSSRNTAKAV